MKRKDAKSAKKYQYLLIVPLLWAQVACGSMFRSDPQSVAGVYRYAHGFASVEVHLRDDGTFVYREWHDVGGWQQTEGTYRQLSPELLIANTSKPVPRSTIAAQVEPYLHYLTVAVRDDNGTAIPGATVTLTCQESGESVRNTDAGGQTSFPECTPETLRVELHGFRTATASPSEPGANRFEVALVLDEHRIDNERWIVLDGRLFFAPHQPLSLIDEDGDR